jgi:hypothetical protein
MRRGSDIVWEDQFATACENQDIGEIERLVDLGLRHRKAEPLEYLEHWLRVARLFAYATHDDSWGELEKEFAIIIVELVRKGSRPGVR